MLSRNFESARDPAKEGVPSTDLQLVFGPDARFFRSICAYRDTRENSCKDTHPVLSDYKDQVGRVVELLSLPNTFGTDYNRRELALIFQRSLAYGKESTDALVASVNKRLQELGSNIVLSGQFSQRTDSYVSTDPNVPQVKFGVPVHSVKLSVSRLDDPARDVAFDFVPAPFHHPKYWKRAD